MLNIVLHAIERGVKYQDGQIYGVSGKVLKPRHGGKGYRVVQLPKPDGSFCNIYVHKLVYWFETADNRAFDNQYEIHHKDTNRANNSFDNLELMLARDHESMSSRLNTRAAKITLEQADEIRAEYTKGAVSQKALAKIYGLTQQTISDIMKGKSWGVKRKR